MARWFVVLGVVLALGAVQPADAAAQNPQTRQGFFITFGFGGGSLGCDDCGGHRETGPGVLLHLGGTLNERLLLGGEISVWSKEEGGVRITHGNVSAALQFYPSATSGFFIKGGAGGSTLEIEFTSGETSISGEQGGLGLTAGLGYDIRLGSNFSLTPYGMFGFGSFGNGSANNFQLGLAATFH